MKLYLIAMHVSSTITVIQCMFQYVLSDLTRFVDPENIGVDTRIRILCRLELAVLARLLFNLGYQYVFLNNNCIINKIRDTKLSFITMPNITSLLYIFLYNVNKYNWICSSSPHRNELIFLKVVSCYSLTLKT